MESKILSTEVNKIEVPVYKKFSDIVDQMLFDFKEMKQSDIIIQKLAPNNYIFGTKKIYAKVTNGVLLIRVGGGFMGIENFYDLYGEQELINQVRKAEREAKKLAGEGENTGYVPKAKLPDFKKKKAAEGNSKDQTVQDSSLMDKFSGIEGDSNFYYHDSVPGDYEISLAEHEETEGSVESQQTLPKEYQAINLP